MYYYSVSDEVIGEIVIKKSRFIGYISPVNSETEAEDIVKKAKQKWPNARHYCYAYVLREQNLERYSDDGEPSGTAGVPILGVLRNQNLENIIVVVTRYFGGTLLGAPGLVRAYSNATSQVIQRASIKKYVLCAHIQITADYSYWSNIEYNLLKEKLLINNVEYLEQVKAELYTPVDKEEKVIKQITSLSNGTTIINKYANQYVSLN